MGWRTIKCGYIHVSHEGPEEEVVPRELRWCALMYDVYMKWMKLEIKTSRLQDIPLISLVLKPNSVNLGFHSNEPNFIVDIQSKGLDKITLSIENDLPHDHQDVTEWQTHFKTAVNTAVMYAVFLTKEDKFAILCINESNVQISSAEDISEERRHSTVYNFNVISTDVQAVSMTLDDTIFLTLDDHIIVLRTARLIELYQHLISYSSGKRNAVGAFNIVHFDYENVRRDSSHLMISEDEDDADNDMYVVHAPILSCKATPNASPIGSPKTSRKASPELGSTTRDRKPHPPPKPTNYMAEFVKIDEPEPIYKTAHPDYKKSISVVSSTSSIYATMDNVVDEGDPPTSSIYATMDNVVDEGDPPALPETPPQYLEQAAVHDSHQDHSDGIYQNYNPTVEYENVKRIKEFPQSDTHLHGAVTPSDKKRQNQGKSVAVLSGNNSDTIEEDAVMYEDLYALGVATPASRRINPQPSVSVPNFLERIQKLDMKMKSKSEHKIQTDTARHDTFVDREKELFSKRKDRKMLIRRNTNSTFYD